MENIKPKVDLKGLRSLRGLSQSELGMRIDKSVYTIINWEAGKTSPTIKDYYKLKATLDDKDEFFLIF